MAVGVLAPSLAMAASTTTYVYRYQATGGAPIPGAAEVANPAALKFSLTSFYLSLATDAGKKGQCKFSSTGTTSFSKTNIGLIKAIVATSGDTTYSDGTITTPAPGSSGAVNGFAWFAGFSGTAGLKNSGILNTTNSATAGVICGGTASGSGDATCGNGTLCKNSNLSGATGAADGTNCQTNGGDFVDTNAAKAGINASNLVVFVYPMAGNLCLDQNQTLAECCSDPGLVIITSNHSSVNKGPGPSTLSTVDAQGDGGFSEAYLQPSP
jgi:hypothetical protein